MLYNTTPILCTPLRLHPLLMNSQVLSIAEERSISVTFRAEAAAAHEFGLSLLIGDTEGLKEYVCVYIYIYIYTYIHT